MIEDYIVLFVAILAACTLIFVFVVGSSPSYRVGVVGCICVGALVLMPMGLVPNPVRIAEAVGLAVISAVVLVTRRPGRRAHGVPLAMFGGLALLTTYSTLRGGIPGATYQLSLSLVVGISLLLVGLYATFNERAMIIRFIMGLGVIESLYGVIEIVFRPEVLWGSPVPKIFTWEYSRLGSEVVPGLLRSQGSFGHPLLMSTFLLIGFALACRYNFTSELARFMVCVSLGIGIFTTGSRSGLILMAIVALLAYGHRPREGALKFVSMALAGLAVILVPIAFGSVLTQFTNSGSVSHREGALAAVPGLLAQPRPLVLLGHGWYARQELYDNGLLQSGPFIAVDNQFVSTLISAGIVGVFLTVIGLVSAIVVAGRDVRPALMVITACFVVYDVMEFPSSLAMLMLLVGFASRRTDHVVAVRETTIHSEPIQGRPLPPRPASI